MGTEASARPRKSVAVTVLGLITLVVGGAYAVFGGLLIFAGASWFAEPRDEDPWKQMAALYGIGPAFLIALGVAFLPPCILGLMAGWGVLLRKQWGRILAFIVAVLAMLLGLLWVNGGIQEVDFNTTDIAFGATQFLYGILAFVLLIMKSAEFSRPRK